jgi:hypothetical protein
MSYKKLQCKFPEHRLVRFISTTKECSLSLKERWVYSTLLWRYKCKPVTKARLSKWTGVDRTRTLPRILTRLSNLRLVLRDGKRFKAVEPPTDLAPWFATYISGLGANERIVLAYNWAVYDRSRDIIDNLVICADALSQHTAAKLARRFGVCGKTITAARRRIKKANQENVPPVVSESKPVVVERTPTMPVSLEPVSSSGQDVQIHVSLMARSLAYDYTKYHGIATRAKKELEKLCELFKHMERKEIGQIISALVTKFGKSDGLADAIWNLLRMRYDEYRFPTPYDKIMADIGVGKRDYAGFAEDDDDLSIFGDEDLELAI